MFHFKLLMFSISRGLEAGTSIKEESSDLDETPYRFPLLFIG